jgi:SAM-dependent methyltransferase
MRDGWEWDDTLFQATARYYRRGRLPYAPGLVELLTDVLALDGRGRLIDIGCGPGTLTIPLAASFATTVGVDPDGDMLAHAQQEARRAAPCERMRWIHARAEELPDDLGSFTVATFGQSFHWMDRDAVAATMRRLLRPGGAFVHIADVKTPEPATTALPHPVIPQDAINALIRRYLGPVRRAGRGVLPNGTPDGEADVLRRAGYTGPHRYIVPGGQPLERGIAEIVAGVFSLSSSAPHLFGDHAPAFEADLRALLRRTAPGGRFSQRQPSTEVVVWRRPATS